MLSFDVSETYFTAYQDYLAFEKNYSPNTVEHYLRDLRQARPFFEGLSVTAWDILSDEHIETWAAALFSKGISGRSIARKLSSLRGFYRYLIKQGLAQQNPVELVKAPKATQKLPNVLDVEQAQHILDPKHALSPIDVRDLAMLELIYACGLRVSELHQLNLDDVHPKDKRVFVTGKGNKERLVPVGDQALHMLNTWMEERTLWPNVDEQALFISKRGTRLTIRQIQKRFKQWSRIMGAPHLHPHLFRHAFATHVLESSQNIRAVQTLLGHENIKSTQVYTHLDMAALKDVYEKAHPKG